MADISTQEDKEFEALHPNLKQLYTGGFDLYLEKKSMHKVQVML